MLRIKSRKIIEKINNHKASTIKQAIEKFDTYKSRDKYANELYNSPKFKYNEVKKRRHKHNKKKFRKETRTVDKWLSQEQSCTEYQNATKIESLQSNYAVLCKNRFSSLEIKNNNEDHELITNLTKKNIEEETPKPNDSRSENGGLAPIILYLFFNKLIENAWFITLFLDMINITKEMMSVNNLDVLNGEKIKENLIQSTLKKQIAESSKQLQKESTNGTPVHNTKKTKLDETRTYVQQRRSLSQESSDETKAKRIKSTAMSEIEQRNAMDTESDTSGIVKQNSMTQEKSKPKVITRESLQEKKKRFENKPNAILIFLMDDQNKFIDNNDLDKYISDKTDIKLDSRSGSNGKGHTKIGKKLFLYPESDRDHDNILRNKNWMFNKNQMTSLENRSNYVILRGISINEIENSQTIRQDFSKMNIESWSALIEGENNHLAVKCKMITRADLSEILSNYYIDGKKYLLPNNKIAQVRFDPDIQNPIQCYACYKFEGHTAEKCPLEHPKCEHCGETKHVDPLKQEKCEKKACCINCGKTHGARDKRCEVSTAERNSKMQSQVHLITGKFLVRPPRNRRSQYVEMVKKHQESFTAEKDFDNWKSSANSRVDNIERRYEDGLKKMEGDMTEIKCKAGAYVDDMKKILQIAENSIAKINDHMDLSIEIRCKKIESKILEIEAKSETIATNLDSWRMKVETNLEEKENKIAKAEHFIESFKQAWSQTGNSAFWIQ